MKFIKKIVYAIPITIALYLILAFLESLNLMPLQNIFTLIGLILLFLATLSEILFATL